MLPFINGLVVLIFCIRSTIAMLPHSDLISLCYISLPSDVLPVLALTHRVFDYDTVYYIVAQVQLEAQKHHQHSPCKMATSISGKKG